METVDHNLETPRSNVKIYISLLLGLIAAIVLLWLQYGGLPSFFARLDPGNAPRCKIFGRLAPLCDYTVVYYVQGLQLNQNISEPVFGFYYSPFFALFMKFLASFPYYMGYTLWFLLVLTAQLTLLSMPVILGYLRSCKMAFMYAILFAFTVPVMHEFFYGQVTSMIYVLVIFSMALYSRKKTTLSACLMALAVAIKFYPALFVLIPFAKRDWKWLGMFAAASCAFIFVFPMIVLTPEVYFHFVQSLSKNWRELSLFLANNPYSNFSATALEYTFLRSINPTGLIHKLLIALSMGIALTQMYLVMRTARQNRMVLSMFLLFLTFPFVVKSSWVNYFVFLPLLQIYLLIHAKQMESKKYRQVMYVGSIVSIVLCSHPFFLLFSNADLYYRSFFPFWSVVFLLPGFFLLEKTATAPASR